MKLPEDIRTWGAFFGILLFIERFLGSILSFSIGLIILCYFNINCLIDSSRKIYDYCCQLCGGCYMKYKNNYPNIITMNHYTNKVTLTNSKMLGCDQWSFTILIDEKIDLEYIVIQQICFRGTWLQKKEFRNVSSYGHELTFQVQRKFVKDDLVKFIETTLDLFSIYYSLKRYSC